MENIFTRRVNFHPVTIKMSDGSVFTGQVNIRNCARLSEFLRSTDDRFIVILVEAEGEKSPRVMMVNKTFVLWAETPA
jgi:hypothetical protein